MAFLNQNLWKSAYLIEFCIGNIVEEAFTFSVPPQSEEFIYPQRINETKTFGGSVFEDYGNDTVQIQLSGTTINQQLKIIYRSKFPEKYLSGEDEIFYLKDIFDKFGKFNKLQNKEVHLFCLEPNSSSSKKSNNKSWRIWPQELSIRRTKDRPLSYDYTLKALGLPIGKKTAITGIKRKEIKKLKNFQDKIDKFTEDVRKTLDDFKDKVANFWNDNVLSYISAAKGCLASINNLSETFTAYFTENADLLNSLLVETFTEVTAIGTEIAKTVTLPVYVGIELNNKCNELIKNISLIKDWAIEITGKDTNPLKQAVNYYKASQEDIVDSIITLTRNIENSANSVVVETKSYISKHNEFPIVIPGDNGEVDEISIAYGYQKYLYHTGDTWASIAYKFYNDASYATMLQLYNSEIDLNSIQPGDNIYCPILESTEQSNDNNQVYADFGVIDLYGSDIMIKGEDFSVQNGDFMLTNNVLTINQAITSRLNTSINSRVRNVVYGIRYESGLPEDGKDAAATYITASIQQTILSDPRIESIDQITWTGEGTELKIDVSYTTISGDSQTYTGVI